MIGSPLPHPPHTVHPRMPSGYPWSQDPDAGPYSTATGPGPPAPRIPPSGGSVAGSRPAGSSVLPMYLGVPAEP